MKPKQLYIILLSTIGVVTLGGLAAFVLTQKPLSLRITKLRRLSADIVLETEQISRLRSLEADYKKIEPLALKVQSVLPAQKQQGEVVAQVSTIVRNNGLSLTALTFDTTSGLPDERSQTVAGTIGGILIMPVRFETTGSYQQLAALMRSFEQQQRYMRVSILEVSRNDNGSVTANVTLEVFFKP